MTDRCDDVRERAFLGRAEAGDAEHVAACATCGDVTPVLGELAATFAAHRVAEPTPGLDVRVAAKARPLLLARRRHAARRQIAAALVAALVPLPLIVVLDVWALRVMYDVLRWLLPEPLSLYLIVNYAAVLALLGTLTYGAIPLLAERQARSRPEVLHG